jgi:hypothetical protein
VKHGFLLGGGVGGDVNVGFFFYWDEPFLICPTPTRLIKKKGEKEKKKGQMALYNDKHYENYCTILSAFDEMGLSDYLHFMKNFSFNSPLKRYLKDKADELKDRKQFEYFVRKYYKDHIRINKKLAKNLKNDEACVSLCLVTFDDPGEIKSLPLKDKHNEGGSSIFPAYAKCGDFLECINPKNNIVTVKATVKFYSKWIELSLPMGVREKNLVRNEKFMNSVRKIKDKYMLLCFEQETPSHGYPFDNLTIPGGKLGYRGEFRRYETFREAGERELVEELFNKERFDKERVLELVCCYMCKKYTECDGSHTNKETKLFFTEGIRWRRVGVFRFRLLRKKEQS